MKKHHRHSSFNTFAQRILGFDSLSEEQLSYLQHRFEYTRRISVIDGKTQLRLLLKGIKSHNAINIEKVVDEDLVAKESFKSTFERRLYQLDSQLFHLLRHLSSEVEVQNLPVVLDELTVLLTADLEIGQEKREVLFNFISSGLVLRHFIAEALEIAILLSSELEFAVNVKSAIPILLSDEQFLKKPKNVRTLQKVLAYLCSVAGYKQEIISAIVDSRLSSIDVRLSLLLTVSNDMEEFGSLVKELDLSELDTEREALYFVVQTLNRSPAKLPFLFNSALLTYLTSTLSLNHSHHVALAFRSLYFSEKYDLMQFFNVDKLDIIKHVLALDDNNFNKLYRDVRRSSAKVLNADEVSYLIRELDIETLSFNKWIYLLSLLVECVDLADRLAFIQEVLLQHNFKSVDSGMPLTLIAASGLKTLTSQIINDLYRSQSAFPVLPEVNVYTLDDIFSSVLRCCKNSKAVANDVGLVSVVITTFNPNLKLLSQSIESILGQTYKNLEVIVVDDCSTLENDKLKNLCSTFDNEKVTFIRNEKNVGQYISRNIAIESARGEFIAIQDDDDVSHPERLARQLDEITTTGSLACFTKHIRYSDDGHLSIDDPRNLIAFGDGPASLVFKKELLKTVGSFRDYRSRGDIDFRTRVETLLGVEAISYLDLPLYIMRSSLSTVSSLYEYKNGDLLDYFRNRIELLKTRKEFYKKGSNV